MFPKVEPLVWALASLTLSADFVQTYFAAVRESSRVTDRNQSGNASTKQQQQQQQQQSVRSYWQRQTISQIGSNRHSHNKLICCLSCCAIVARESQAELRWEWPSMASLFLGLRFEWAVREEAVAVAGKLPAPRSSVTVMDVLLARLPWPSLSAVFSLILLLLLRSFSCCSTWHSFPLSVLCPRALWTPLEQPKRIRSKPVANIATFHFSS